MRTTLLIGVLIFSASYTKAFSSSEPSASELRQKILTQGVPADAYDRLIRFIDTNRERPYVIDTYSCAEKPLESIQPCHESARSRSTQTVSFQDPQHVVIVDFSQYSSARRLYLIDLKNGQVERFYASHGIGSGEGNQATFFSNTKDSRQTSLGVYFIGGTYFGKYGESLRMYGLEPSNNDSYNRDIVMHGAWYAEESFMERINPKTQEKFGRLGVSWGCPAVAQNVIKKLIPLLQNGGLVYHYHSFLADKTDTGAQVTAPLRPVANPFRNAKRPQSRPENLKIPAHYETASE